MKNKLSQSTYIVIGTVILIIVIALLFSGKNNSSSSQSNSATSTSATSSNSVKNSGGQTYYNASLGFSFVNPHPSSWIMTTNNTDGSLVYFGPKVVQEGVGLKVYYWPGSTEFPLFGKIATITDLKNAVSEQYKQVIPYYIKTIYSGGLSMIEVENLTTSFGTSNIYFVLLLGGTLNFGGTGDLSALIQKI